MLKDWLGILYTNMECQYCKNIFRSASILKTHQKTAKYCIKLRPANEETEAEMRTCPHCEKDYTYSNISRHIKTCSAKKENDIKDNEDRLTELVAEKDRENNYLKEQIEDYKSRLDMSIDKKNRLRLKVEKTRNSLKSKREIIEKHELELEDKIKQIDELKQIIIEKDKKIVELKFSSKTVDKYQEHIAYLKKQLTEKDSYNRKIDQPTVDLVTVEHKIHEDEIEEEIEYHPEPLVLKEGYQLEHREEDGYINVTNLCKAGEKEYKNWNSNKKAKSFIKALSSTAGIPAVELIKYKTGGNGERHTWVHPYIAINIAQWISPEFDVKVATWVYEIMLTGKVDITKTKPYQELQEENKEKEIEIQKLTKKYVSKQKRVQYEQENVIYILTTENMKKENRYILGKATNLTKRLSTYNKTDEHEVIFHKQCLDKDIMSFAETMIFRKLEEYREQANRERFILPKNETANLFIDVVKKIIESLEKI